MTHAQPKLSHEVMKDCVHKQFFPEGKEDERSVGLELEFWPLRHTAERPNEVIPFYNDAGTGLIQLLQSFEPKIEGLKWAPAANGTPRFELAGGGQLTFEPGGQLEYSGPPKVNIGEAIAEITDVIETLRCQFKNHDVWLFHSGLNPWYKVEEIELQLQKPRYIHMNNYFQAVGPYGQKMMRLSTTFQVNLDVGDPDTAHHRWRASNLLAPVFTAMFGNSPFADRRATGARSFRSLIWQHLDNSRTGFQQGFLKNPYKPCPVEQYFEFALHANVMRLPNASGEQGFWGNFVTFKEWMDKGVEGRYPSVEEWDNHLTTLFPEVRARGFFEYRFLDGQSKVWCAIPGVLLANLIYDESACKQIIEWLDPYRATLPGMLEVAAKKGMTDDELAGLGDKIFRLGLDKAGQNEDKPVVDLCEQFYDRYTGKKRSPADDLIELNDGKVFEPHQYRDFERRQVDAAGPLLAIICDFN